jgi:pilus assembly protein Flp/PilA
MGPPARSDELSDAARRLAAYTDVARFHLKRFLTDMSGATAIEYAMVAAGIAVAVVSAVNVLGQNVYNSFFAKIANGIH